jgi:pimeloyl-ACP methyl ester carboxylesterase
MGGRVALEVMRQAASRVERLALLDTGFRARPLGPAGEDERAKRQHLVDVADRCGVRAMALQWVQAMVHPDRQQDEDLIERIVAMFGRKSAETFRRQVQALLERPDASGVLAGIRVPTLVLCGRQDSWAPVSQHEAMVALLPGSGRLHVVEQAGHMCTMERPQDVGKVLQAWMLGTSA